MDLGGTIANKPLKYQYKVNKTQGWSSIAWRNSQSRAVEDQTSDNIIARYKLPAVPTFLGVHELAPPGMTLCHGTGADRETLFVHGGSSRAGFPCGVCALPTEFPMTVHFLRAWKHDGWDTIHMTKHTKRRQYSKALLWVCFASDFTSMLCWSTRPFITWGWKLYSPLHLHSSSSKEIIFRSNFTGRKGEGLH